MKIREYVADVLLLWTVVWGILGIALEGANLKIIYPTEFSWKKSTKFVYFFKNLKSFLTLFIIPYVTSHIVLG